MKLKTEKEIEVLAHDHALISLYEHRQTAYFSYKSGYTQAQQDLLASASEGFDEHLSSMGAEAFVKEGKDSVNLAKHFWQACSLSHAKKMQEKDAEIESLKKKFKNEEDCWLISMESRDEKITDLQKENEELKVNIKLLEMNQHFMEKEIKGEAK